MTVPRQAWAFADCRTAPFPGKAGSDTVLPEGRVRPVEAVRAGLHGEGSARARHRTGRNARHRLVLPPCRDAMPPARANPVAGVVSHAIAVGDSQSGNFIKTFVHLGFNQDLSQQHRLGRRVSAHRREADADQLPIRAAGRRGDALRAGQRAGRLVGQVQDKVARAARGKPARSVLAPRHTCPKVIEAFGAIGVLGSANVARTDWHRRCARHPAAGERPPLLLSGHDARRRAWRLSSRRRGLGVRRLHAAGESESGSRHDSRADARH